MMVPLYSGKLRKPVTTLVVFKKVWPLDASHAKKHMTGTGGGLIRPTTEAQMKMKPAKHWTVPAAMTTQGPPSDAHLDLAAAEARWVV